MTDTDETDSVVRAVAAAPSVRPPARRATAILVEPGATGALDRVRQLAAPLDAEVTARADGRLLAVVPAGRASDAASCALALRGALPLARIALATGPAGAGPAAVAAIVDRAAALLSGAGAADAIRIDDATADLLDASFEVRRDESQSLLVRRRSSPPIYPPPDGVDTGALGLVRWGLRFSNPDTEAAYRAWNARRAIPFVRAAAILALTTQLVSAGFLRLVSPATFPSIAMVALVVAISSSAAIVCTYQPRLAGRILSIAVVVSLVGGFANVATFFWLVDLPKAPGMASAAAAISVLAAAGLLRLRPTVTFVATAPVVGFAQLLYLRKFLAGRIDASLLGLYSFSVWINLAGGILIAAAIDRVSRRSYRQERIIELQREVIDRLQRAELQRQVAERSRGLSEALSRLSDAPPGPTRLSPGDLVEERYRIVRAIGAGGMGQVHEVERISDRRHLALKVLTGAADRAALARFAREAQVAAELNHPNVVAALDVGVTRSGTLFFVMELVAGSSLAAARDRYGGVGWAVPIIAQVARALAAMHVRGIVHRDLKPSNILLDGETAKVADFGLAGLLDRAPFAETRELADPPSLALTRTGAIMGTPLYMAPELVRGAREAGPAADLFSLGVVAYELLSTGLPYPAPPVLERLAGRAAPSLRPLSHAARELPAALCALVDRCLAEAPSERPSAEAVAAAFGQPA